ncbi:CarD family transcriptional regulator [Aneurinibacillus soli]|uniref:RNA polymerase-binding transcription factor CarD n=1 Tax=Aneurinibacillus soli TaxID=1500254 RepID=A0A0U4WI94_9BACL|nr:CarD family transcriptional regulator [Aneurinibacillus soli]BAU28313.1 RNA polymerase-binding transcription factor CarD [Aneurinibacillus soli]
MFQVGDKIVYPMHGAGVIEAIEEKEILGEKQQYYVIKMPIGNMQVLVPMGKASDVGIRLAVDMLTLENTLLVFRDRELEQSLPWSQRYRINMDKIKTGAIQEGAEVICDLMRMNERKALNSSEKRMLDNAKDMLISELALVKGFTENQAIDFLHAEVYN